jgi:hypothetical protein
VRAPLPVFIPYSRYQPGAGAKTRLTKKEPAASALPLRVMTVQCLPYR